MRKRLLWSVLLVAPFFVPLVPILRGSPVCSAVAQGLGESTTTTTVTTTTVSGVVVDAQASSMSTLPDVVVELSGRDNSRTTRTNHLGVYSFAQVEAGQYTLTFQHPRFQTVKRELPVQVSPLGVMAHQPLVPNGTALIEQTPVGPGTLFVTFQDRPRRHQPKSSLDVMQELLVNPDLPSRGHQGAWPSALDLEPNPISLDSNHLMTLPPASPGRSRFDRLGGAPNWAVFSGDGKTLAIGTHVSSQHVLSLYDTSSGTRWTQNLPLAGPVVDLQSVDRERVLVTVLGQPSSLSVIDLVQGKYVGRWTVPGSLSAAVMRNDRIYACSTSNNQLIVLDARNGREVATVALGKTPTSLALTPDGRQLFCSNSASASVSVIDTSTLQELRKIPVGVGPQRLLVTPDASRLFVSNRSSDTVSVIDLASLQPISTVRVAASPLGLASSPDSKRVYVASVEGGLIQFLNGKTGKIEHSTNPMPNSRPWGLAVRP